VCFRRLGAADWIGCVPYSSAAANVKKDFATPSRPIPIKISDLLLGKGIDIVIWEGQFPSASYSVSYDNIKATALCLGLRMAASTASGDTRVLAFLDDL